MPLAPAFKLAGSGVNNATSIAVAWPSHATNDVGLLIVEQSNQSGVTLTTAANFTTLVAAVGTGTAAVASSVGIQVYWARATSAAMPNVTVSGATDHIYAQILTFSSVVQSGNPYDVTFSGVKATTSSQVTVTSAATTTINNALIVVIVGHGNDSAAAQFTNWANANLATITERVDAGTTTGTGGGFGVITGTLAAPGAIGNTTATQATAVTFKNAYAVIALKGTPTMPVTLAAVSGRGTVNASVQNWLTVLGGVVAGTASVSVSVGIARTAAVAAVAGAGVATVTLSKIIGSSGQLTVSAVTGRATTSVTLGKVPKVLTVAAVAGAATPMVSIQQWVTSDMGAVAGVGTVTVTVGAKRLAAVSAVLGIGTATVTLSKVGGKVLTLAAITGAGAAAATVAAIRRVTFTGPAGAATVTVTLGKVVPGVNVAAAGFGTATVTIGAKRRVTVTGPAGQGTAAVTIGALRRMTVASVQGQASASVSALRWRYIAPGTASGRAVASVVVAARRSLLTEADGAGTASVVLGRLGGHHVDAFTAAGQSVVTVTLDRLAVAAAVTGKYERQFDTAGRLIANLPDGAHFHALAGRVLTDKGV